MRLQAKEDEVYHLMDLKEWFSVLIGLGSFLEGNRALFFHLSNKGLGSCLFVCGTGS